MPTPETELANFAACLQYDDIPTDTCDIIQRAFLDTVGVTLAGTVEGAGKSMFETTNVQPMDVNAATLLGITGDDAAAERALRVGTASHALDYDDLSWGMDGHPSVTLIPPLLALAEETNASGEDLLTAYAAGFEVECALAQPISPDHYETGWHATATFGMFGAAVAAATLLNLDTVETRYALNIAASTPAGLKRNFGSMTKPLHAGLCARSGVTAARLAGDGFTADTTAVSGDRGFWNLYGPHKRDKFEFNSQEWAFERHGIHVKAYPCCYFTHTSIAATQALVTEHDIGPSDIDRIHVRAAQGAADALHHTDPDTGLEAKFSMAYTVASAVVRDRVGLGAFDDNAIDDSAVQHIRERVRFEVDEDFQYDSHTAHVRINTAEDTYNRRQEDPPGTHDNPLTDAELQHKFEECASRALPTDEIDRLADVLWSLPTLSTAATALAGRR